ncbi:MAG: LON peptidase substrate-binding domain-containing protein [Pseudomonadota bacterium]|nr:LON peptidase substrate-binding domain-containing protein [Pseudomonadota bacterium]
MTASSEPTELPLFPLQAVLFPGGLLVLKVFEARYLDLVARCMRESSAFGVVGLKRGTEVRRPKQQIALEAIGTKAELIDVDSAQAGILQVRCRGTERFEIRSSRQQPDGLWLAETSPVEADDVVAPSAALKGATGGLADAIAALDTQGEQPFLAPYRFDDAGWVANRWCEILPIPIAARQRLMELRDPLVRLEIVDEFLRSKGVVG